MMAGLSQSDPIELNMLIPRGHDAIWATILDLDARGQWTIADIRSLTVSDDQSIRDFVRRLVRGGFAAGDDADTQAVNQPRNYRLLKRPIETPRLRRDGTEYPELQQDTLWRTIKMAKTFTASELADMASSENRSVNRVTAKTYLAQLAEVGILARLNTERSRIETRYRLVRNLGARAPKILRANVVFDPNSRTVIGDPIAREVQS